MAECPHCFKSPGCPVCLGEGAVPFGFAVEYAFLKLNDAFDHDEVDPITGHAWRRNVDKLRREHGLLAKGDQ